MKNLINLFTLLFGFSNSYSSDNTTNYHYYHNGKEITENEFVKLENAQYPNPKIQTPVSQLSKREFVIYMAKKNIICV